ncbi:hypothetical protein A3D78_00200 [Candidatus Gottesmanbacteria bacterium RIFCSPHIGHO2_02_FULL_39_14]|uniref:NAD(P)-binding domain-containing protein n=1 Tax=Candidatus Gottesmanbacteria bacterium RIFCSPHIGHO2_02_FULL_39_14 TaxID=1798383 RepID=A0A1F5ZVT4_9BACT|nr:MAG: hypothetical protein A3D78_00200 [Candidatus Gottesmanbacteria bacterium RIFCSPHIGHO2_02_FULL_39_14]
MAVNFNDSNILVTGGTGFVGSHLIEALLKEKANVITTYQRITSSSYFSSKKLNEKSIMVQADVGNFEKVFDIITKFRIDYIFHLAAQPLVEVAYYNPRQTLFTNIVGTINVLESARLYSHVKGIIVASSDKAYGKLSKKKIVESDPLLGDHPYEVSKSATHLISNSYYKTYNLPCVVTRFGNIYGEGDLNYSRIIPGLMKAVVKNDTFVIRSDGNFTRDYLYVTDVVNGYISLAANIEKVKGEVFNFGSDEILSVLRVTELVGKILSKNIKYKIIDVTHNEIPYQSLSYSKIKKVLDWTPKHSLTSKIKDIYQWYKKIL